jgi:hypothetical protein
MKKQITKKITIELSDMYDLANTNKKQNVVCLTQDRHPALVPSSIYLTKSQIEKIYKESMKLLKEDP